MSIIITSLLTFLSSIVGKFLTDSLLRFLAWKTLIFTLLTVTFPVVIKNLITWLFNVLTASVGNIDTSGISSVVVQFTGFAAYLADKLHLVDCLSIILTALAIRFALNFIPFIG